MRGVSSCPELYRYSYIHKDRMAAHRAQLLEFAAEEQRLCEGRRTWDALALSISLIVLCKPFNNTQPVKQAQDRERADLTSVTATIDQELTHARHVQTQRANELREEQRKLDECRERVRAVQAERALAMARREPEYRRFVEALCMEIQGVSGMFLFVMLFFIMVSGNDELAVSMHGQLPQIHAQPP